MIWFVESFFIVLAKFECGRIIYWFFDEWVKFCRTFLRDCFEVSGRSS